MEPSFDVLQLLLLKNVCHSPVFSGRINVSANAFTGEPQRKALQRLPKYLAHLATRTRKNSSGAEMSSMFRNGDHEKTQKTWSDVRPQ